MDNKNPPTMFENLKIDRFFRWPWWIVPCLWLPVAAWLLYFGRGHHPIPIGLMLLIFALGIGMWTFVEYCTHRFILHFAGKSRFMQRLHYVSHGMHHAWPNNPDRVIIPPFAAIILALFYAGIFYLIVSPKIFYPLFAGFAVGYVWYECTHYAVHHFKWKMPLFKAIKRHHLLHHHNSRAAEKKFGVTTPFWDFVFRTLN